MASLEDRYAEYFGEDNLVAQELMNQYNNESALQQMDFQEYMSSSAHQREVADLIAAGLNPQLSANAGAPAMTGAYTAIDSTPNAAAAQRKMQLELQKNDIANQLTMQQNALKNEQIINKYSVDKSVELGRYQAKVGAAATRYAAGAAASAARYGAATSAAAAKYGYDLNYKNNQQQRAWDSLHPTNAYQAGGSVLEYLFNGNSKSSANAVKNSSSYGSGSSAK